MEICPRCNRRFEGTSLTCPHCGVNTALYAGPESAGAAADPAAADWPDDDAPAGSRPLAATGASRTNAGSSRAPLPDRGGRTPRRPRELGRFPVIKLTLVLFAAGMLVWWLLPRKLDEVMLTPARANATGRDPCAGKACCVLVYLAPWCPACKLSLPVVQGLQRHYAGSPAVGIKPVVGGGRSRENMEQMAADFGDGAFVDPSGSLMRAAGAETVPQWLVVDAEGFLIEQMPGVLPDVQAMITELDLGQCEPGG